MEHPPEHLPKLLDQLRNAIRLKHYSLRTEQSYVDWIKSHIFFHTKVPMLYLSPNTFLAITILWISLVPSPIVISRWSR